MKKLIVCGDSYMSPVVNEYAETHFSEIVSKKLGYKLVAYSRGGMSNGGICIQINTAITLDPKPDLILIGNTHAERMEFPINLIKKVDKFTIDELLYSHKTSLSSNYSWINKNPQLVSTALFGLVSGKFRDDDIRQNDKFYPYRMEAIKQWYELLYHPDWKREVDSMMLYSTYHKLHKSGIPYLICFEQLDHIVKECEWLNYGENYINYPKKEIAEIVYKHSSANPNHIDPGYHSTVEAQAEIAELLLKKYLPNIL